MNTGPHSSPDERRLAFEKEVHGRERWWREDELINQRTTWLLTTQAVLGTAYGFVRYRIAELTHQNLAKGLPDFDLKPYLETLRVFATCLVTIGIVSSLVTLMGIFAAQWAQKFLQKQYGRHLGVNPLTTRLGHLTALATPSLFIIAWAWAAFLFRQAC